MSLQLNGTSAPGHANANGKAESGVKAAKHMMEKCKRSHTDPFMAMLEIRNTPTQGAARQQPSTAHIKQTHEDHVTGYSDSPGPRAELHNDYDRLKLQHSQAMQAYHYNRGAKDLHVLEEGDSVRMKPFRLGQKTWQRGTVITRLDERSYEMDTPTGTYRRNRVHL